MMAPSNTKNEVDAAELLNLDDINLRMSENIDI